MSGKRRLIVSADDLGRSPGINEGIFRAHRDGIVTSATLMVNTPWSGQAVEGLDTVPKLGVGLHLNFCYGRPVSEPAAVASLLDSSGEFETRVPTLVERADRSHIRTETLAQVQRFSSLLGRLPTHLDTHKYVHSHAPFTSVVAEIAVDLGIPVRSTEESDRRRIRKIGALTPDHFEGRFHGLDGEGVDQAILDRAIRELMPGTTELMCHPGLVDDHLADSSYRQDRERELAVLCSRRTRDALAASGAELATFRSIFTRK